MKLKEFIERGFFCDEKGKIYDNSLNENIEDLFLEDLTEEMISELFYDERNESLREILRE